VAAPTAGLHLTAGILRAVEAAGATVRRLTLHVGPGTFRLIAGPVESHRMDPERFEVPAATRAAVRDALREGRRVAAVGTTSVRVLETLGPEGLAEDGPIAGDATLFIRPGYTFRVVGAALTNFHLPNSTPLQLAAALAGEELLARAYAEAVRERYRFLSYGDAMWIA
jgi:S-adenosylmethionine:tRNA ribosyltransferase-isomerase